MNNNPLGLLDKMRHPVITLNLLFSPFFLNAEGSRPIEDRATTLPLAQIVRLPVSHDRVLRHYGQDLR
jgi:hypothetical protein